MNEEDIRRYEMDIANAQITNQSVQLGQRQQELLMMGDNKSLVSEQLDLNDVLENIHYLLRGYVKIINEHGEFEWRPPENNDLVILSEHGINYIMGAVQWYLNKNTLLSNYDDEQILAKMEDVATTISDDIFMEYDKMFLYPTLEDCKDEIKERINKKIDLRKFSYNILGKEINEKEIEKEILRDMEDRILIELDHIRQQKIKNKLKRFESLMRFIQDQIHSAYQRAWKGQERGTLRQITHISETRGGLNQPQKSAGFNPFGLFRRKQQS